MKKLSAFFAIIFAGLIMVLVATPSVATIISTSQSVYYVDPPTSVLLNAEESNDQIIIFDELQNFILTSDVDLDITLPGDYGTPTGTLPSGTVLAGINVDVHLLHFDPEGVQELINLQGQITFGADILGVIVFDEGLYASDWLGNPTTSYPTSSFTQRGLEFRPQDYLTLSEDMRTLSVDFWAQNKLDEVRIITLAAPEPCTIDIHPDTLNKKSKGKYVTCYIELPEDYDVNDIDIATVALVDVSGNQLDPALNTVGPFEIGDYNDNGIPDLMVKFDRQLLQDVCSAGAMEITVWCESYIGDFFEGTDTVLVIDKGQEHFSEDHGTVVY